MKFTYRIDRQDRIVYLGGANPGLTEWMQTLTRLFADSEYEPGYNFLSDRRGFDKPRSAEFLRGALRFLEVHADQTGACKWATVVSTTAAYGMGQMTEVLSEGLGIKVKVFTDLEEARLWLMEGKKEDET